MWVRSFALVQRAKTAGVVGIVVGTLSVAGYGAVLASLRRVIADAGLQSYTFVVGKLTVEKLGNFGEVDVFVRVACKQSTIIDSKVRDLRAAVLVPLRCAVSSSALPSALLGRRITSPF